MHLGAAAAVLFVASFAAGQESSRSSAPAPAARTLPVSLDRVREALRRPPALTVALPPYKADFRIEILERQRGELFLPPIDFTSDTKISPLVAPRSPGFPSAAGAAGGVSVDPGAMARAIRRYFAEKAAHAEVEQALLEFCATHTCSPTPASGR